MSDGQECQQCRRSFRRCECGRELEQVMEQMKVIFLDIDGVLNGHNYDKLSRSCLILPQCVQHLNQILDETGAKLVISSAWRYMVSGGAMTRSGFDYMLRTHGIRASKVLDITRPDDGQRRDDIQDWLDKHPEVTRWVVIDDEPEGMIASPDPERFVKTLGHVGLTHDDALKAISILNQE